MEEFLKLAADMSKNQVLNEIKAHPKKWELFGGSLLMITAGEASGSEPVKIERREAAMLYNYYFIIVLILLLPVTLNIILPLIMLAVWLLKQLVFGSRK